MVLKVNDREEVMGIEAKIAESEGVDPTPREDSEDQLSDYIKGYAKLFVALREKNRLKIVIRLYSAENGLNVGYLAEYIKMSQPVASSHLRVLKDCNLVYSRRDGRNNFDFLNKDTFRKVLSYKFGD